MPSGQKITLFCNRSPCTSCGRYLVIELENFWKLLKRRLALNLSEADTKKLFGQLFTFQLVYTSLYKEKSKDKYPNATILKALALAGWHTQAIKGLDSKERSKAASTPWSSKPCRWTSKSSRKLRRNSRRRTSSR
jgi:hypothetical protein